MKLSDFFYELPSHRVAQEPLAERDQSRLMVVRRSTGEIQHDTFTNIGRYLPAKSLMVLNNTKVIPARLFGTKTRSGGRVEIFLLKKLSDGYSYETLLNPSGRIRDSEEIVFENEEVTATVTDKARRIVRFNRKNLGNFLKRCGHVPLPPYIRRPDNKNDRQDYQTVYAKAPGSVAAPTAGLHFTRPLLSKLRKQGHAITEVTLHVNLATFKPVVVEDITQHEMHTENYSVAAPIWKKVEAANKKGRPVVAVGTTSCRVLEAVTATGRLKGETDLFIYPGYKFQIADALITNFHLPRSTLLMLVYAFGGTALMRRAYREAIDKEYRFYSYGDGMVIL